jgi:hypothetical protein
MFESQKPSASAEALVVFFGELSGGWEIYFEPRFGGSILFSIFKYIPTLEKEINQG